MFDVKLAREIYGGVPWFVDRASFSTLINILKDSRNGVSFNAVGDEKANSVEFFNVEKSSETYIVNPYSNLKNIPEGADLISVINLNGPITKNGGQSSYGTKQISNQMNRLSNDERVKGHILLTDSGGGSSAAIIYMADSIKNSQALGKPVVQFIEKGGLSASAAYFIGSYSDYIISEDPNNEVGSLGTMIQFAAFPKQSTDPEGVVHVRAYATASVNKNGDFEQAIEGNLEPIINNMLDPINEQFLESVQSNRDGKLKAEQLDGSIYFAKDVVGTLVDEIGGIQSAINKVFELAESKQIKNFTAQSGLTNTSNLLNKKSKLMDLSQLKSEHPAVYQAAFNEGVSQEKDRAGAWLAHSEADLAEVKSGIASGENISATKTQEFLIKGMSQKKIADIQVDSAVTVDTPEAATTDTEEEDEVTAFYANVKSKLKK